MSEAGRPANRPRRGPGRPPNPQAGSGSALAALGVELRSLRGRRNLTLHRLAAMTGYSPQHLGAVERAQVVPSEAVAAACDAALLANGQLVTMMASVIREQASIRNRNQVIRRAHLAPDAGGIDIAASPPAVVDWDRLADSRRRPSRVTRAVVDDLEQITNRQRRLYHDLSSAEMLVHVRAHLGLLTALLDGHQTDVLRERVASAAAEAAGFAAWLWFDLGDVFNAGQCYRDANSAVAEAGDRGLCAYIQGYQGMVTAQTEGVAHALAHFREAAESAPRSLSGTTRSWLMILNAEAMAGTGQPAPAVAAIGRAEELLAGASLASRDAWMYAFDHGSLAAHSGRCYLALNRPAQAARSFERALRLLPASCDRRGAMISIGLARARLACGDRDEAIRLAAAALTTFASRGSAAGVQRVRGLRSDLLRAGLTEAAASLDDHARALGGGG